MALVYLLPFCEQQYIIIQAFVKRAVSANIQSLRRRQSLGKEDGRSEV